MIITKLFEVESAHIVRNCTSERCSHSIHGHSAKIEVSFKCKTLDNAQMVMDFGLMKKSIKSFIDSMDHTYLLCERENPLFIEFIKTNCNRWIELPFNPSAEMLSLWLLVNIQGIVNNTNWANGEGDVEVVSVRYWETRTGSATATPEDIENIWKPEYCSATFSDGVQEDWDDDLANLMEYDEPIQNPIIEQQINLI